MQQFILENFIFIGAALISGAMLLWPALRSRTAGPSLSTLEVTRLINSKNAQLVDVRSAEEFALGSLPNAKNIPNAAINERAGELKKDKPVIVLCGNGKAAGGAAARLRKEGFNEVFVLAGGVAAWREAGLPLKK